MLGPTGLERSSALRPDGKSLVPWHQGKTLAWDVTVVDTLADSHYKATSKKAAAAADRAEFLKREKYSSLTGSYFFQAVGFETMGCWGGEAAAFIAKLGKMIIDRTNEPHALDYLRQRISIEIQRFNAVSILGTLPLSRELDEVFYLVRAG